MQLFVSLNSFSKHLHRFLPACELLKNKNFFIFHSVLNLFCMPWTLTADIFCFKTQLDLCLVLDRSEALRLKTKMHYFIGLSLSCEVKFILKLGLRPNLGLRLLFRFFAKIYFCVFLFLWSWAQTCLALKFKHSGASEQIWLDVECCQWFIRPGYGSNPCESNIFTFEPGLCLYSHNMCMVHSHKHHFNGSFPDKPVLAGREIVGTLSFGLGGSETTRGLSRVPVGWGIHRGWGLPVTAWPACS